MITKSWIADLARWMLDQQVKLNVDKLKPQNEKNSKRQRMRTGSVHRMNTDARKRLKACRNATTASWKKRNIYQRSRHSRSWANENRCGMRGHRILAMLNFSKLMWILTHKKIWMLFTFENDHPKFTRLLETWAMNWDWKNYRWKKWFFCF